MELKKVTINGKEYELVERFIRAGRWHVKISPSFMGHGIFPQANVNWLEGNPSFQSIPKSYVIHHLDGDPLNDDISNLALMQKQHHAAHHWKNIKTHVKFNLKYSKEEREIFFPTKEPRISEYRPGHFRIRFFERFNGTSEEVSFTQWHGKRITTREMAEEVKNTIWKTSTCLTSSEKQ